MYGIQEQFRSRFLLSDNLIEALTNCALMVGISTAAPPYANIRVAIWSHLRTTQSTMALPDTHPADPDLERRYQYPQACHWSGNNR